MKQINYSHYKKQFALSSFILLCFFIIFIRLIQLQIIEHQKFAHYGEKNFIRFKTIPAQRGNILDCHGTTLATNKPVTNLVWNGTGNQQLNQIQYEIIQKIESILDISLSERSLKHAEKFSKSVLLAQNISHQQLSLIAEQCSDTQNITFETSFERFYPYNKLACHILGYLGDAELLVEGKMGLEKLFENTLKGEPGVNLQYINSFGTLLEKKEVKHKSSGQSLTTTINLELQKIAEEAMNTQQAAGAFILFDPATGSIPALVSLPNFDPKLFSKKISSEQWKELQENRPFLNRAFNASYPPASIFKLITVAAALQEEIIDFDTLFDCSGYTLFKKRKYFCNKHSGHGLVTLEEALAYSCNIPCYEIAQQLPIDKLAEYAFEFGLGNKTDTLFSEQYGLIPTNEWKLAQKGEKWWTGETLSASIGQSFLLTTPIQIACMIGAIFKGYLAKPRILISQDIKQTPINIKPKILEFLQEGMKQVIKTGTGKRVNKFENITIYAKTGTAQTIARTKSKRSNPDKHAWFVSYFHTDDNNPLVLVILLEQVGGSRHATNVAKEFFKRYAKLVL